MSYIDLYNTAIHDTRNLYVYNVFVQYRYTLIGEPHPPDPPFRHISMLTYHHKVTCILGLGTLCLYYMLEMKGNMYQCGGYFMPLFCIAFIQLHIVDTTTTWPHSDQNTDTCHFFSKVFQSTTSFYLILWNLMLGPNICSTQLSCLPLNASYMDFCNSIQHLGCGPFFKVLRKIVT